MEARTKNFSTNEISRLLDMVKALAHIIECKKTDKISLDEKDKAWASITDDFNSVTTGPFRSTKVLRTKYYNLKSDLRKRRAAEKRSLYESSGRPPPKQTEDEHDVLLKDIIGEHQIDGPASPYGRDTFIVETFDENVELKASPVPFTPCDSYNPGAIKLETNEKLIEEKSSKSPNQNSLSKLEEIKVKWTERKMKEEVKAIKAESEMRIKHMIELHELQKRLMIEKHELEIKAMSGFQHK